MERAQGKPRVGRHTPEGGYPVRRGFSGYNYCSGILDHPPSRMMTTEFMTTEFVGGIFGTYAAAGIGNAVTDLIFSIANREVTFFSGTAPISFL
jgi:hypothetical protein